jgi:DNA-binding transcriptional regulator WhiA
MKPENPPFVVDSEMAEFLGALSGDGFIGNYGDRKQQFMIQFTGHSETDSEYFPYLERIITKRFPKLNVAYRVKNKTLRMTTYSKELFSYLANTFDFPAGKKGSALSIPTIIKNDENLMRHFIRGVFDTDGCLFFDKRAQYKTPYPRIVLEITSQNLFKEVTRYLSKHFKITTKRKLRKGGFSIYVMEIYGYDQLSKWLALIGFSNRKHLDKITPS